MRRFVRAVQRRIAPFVVLLVSVACGDITSVWYAVPDTVALTSIGSPIMNQPGAFDIIYRVPVKLEAPDATGTWDVYVGTIADSLTLGAPGGIGIVSGAAVAELPGLAFDEVFEAPADTDVYVGDRPLTLRIGTVYVVRSRVVIDGYGANCQYFAKMTPLTLNLDPQVAVLAWVRNPYCHNRNLEGETP